MHWQIKEKAPKEIVDHLIRELQVSPIIANILTQREIETFDEAKDRVAHGLAEIATASHGDGEVPFDFALEAPLSEVQSELRNLDQHEAHTIASPLRFSDEGSEDTLSSEALGSRPSAIAG